MKLNDPQQPLIVKLQNYLLNSTELLINVSDQETSVSEIFNQLELFFGKDDIGQAFLVESKDYIELELLLDNLSQRVPHFIKQITGNSPLEDSEGLDPTGEMYQWYRRIYKKIDTFFNTIDANSKKTNHQLLASTIVATNPNIKIRDLDKLSDYYRHAYIQFLIVSIEKTKKAARGLSYDAISADLAIQNISELKRVSIKGDGNCCFRAIADQLIRVGYQPLYSSHQLRKLAVDHMRKNQTEYLGFIVGNIEDYLKIMRKKKVWGGEREIKALADALNICIILYRHGEEQPLIYGNKQHLMIYLIYNGIDHYDSLIPKDEEANAFKPTTFIKANTEAATDLGVVEVLYITRFSTLMNNYFQQYPAYVFDFFDLFDNYGQYSYAGDFKSKALVFNDFLNFLHEKNENDEINIHRLFLDVHGNKKEYDFFQLNRDKGVLLKEFTNTLVTAFIDRLYPGSEKLKYLSLAYFSNLYHVCQDENQEIRKFLEDRLKKIYDDIIKDPFVMQDKKLVRATENSYEASLMLVYLFTLVPRPHDEVEFAQLEEAIQHSFVISLNLEVSNELPQHDIPKKNIICRWVSSFCTMIRNIFNSLKEHLCKKKTENAEVPRSLSASSFVLVDQSMLDESSAADLQREESNASNITVYFDAEEDPEQLLKKDEVNVPTPQQSNIPL